MNCANCGTNYPDGNSNCPSCGTPNPTFNQQGGYQQQGAYQQQGGYQQGRYQQGGYQQGAYQQPYNNAGGNGFKAPIKNKNIAVCIILSIVTCGIYGIIWMIPALWRMIPLWMDFSWVQMVLG